MDLWQKLSGGLGSAQFRLRRFVRGLWFLPTALSTLAVGTVTLAYYIAHFFPNDLPFTVNDGAVSTILTIMATSMLTVSVFSLSTLVGATSRASDSTTPRAVPLIVEDRTAQTAISIFIGAFLYSIVGIIGLSSGIYSDAGRLILFAVTILVVLIVVVSLIRWIDRISSIGRTSETVDLVRKAAVSALRRLEEAPNHGCVIGRESPPEGFVVTADRTGYVQFLDFARLNGIAQDHGNIYIVVQPGDFVAPGTRIAVLLGAADGEEDRDDTVHHIRATFQIGSERTFERDAAYGVTVLAEIAARALSPALNDSGTAIDVIAALTETFLATSGAFAEPKPQKYECLELSPVTPRALFDASFGVIARDGAARVEVVTGLIKALGLLERDPAYAAAAAALRREAAARAASVLTFGADRRAVAAAYGADPETIAYLSE